MVQIYKTQKSLIDFCVFLSDLFSEVLDVQVKRGAELSTDHLLLFAPKNFQNLGKKRNCVCPVWLTGNILRGEKEILLLCREYFEDLLNPQKATPTDTCNTIKFGKEEIFTLTEVAVAMRALKSEKATGEDEIRPEMLKTLNGYGGRWLTRVCRVAWKFGKTPKDWQTCDHSYIQKRQL